MAYCEQKQDVLHGFVQTSQMGSVSSSSEALFIHTQDTSKNKAMRIESTTAEIVY